MTDRPTPEALEAALRLAIGALRPQRVITGPVEQHMYIEYLPPEYRAAADLLEAYLPALSRAPALVEALRPFAEAWVDNCARDIYISEPIMRRAAEVVAALDAGEAGE